MLCTQPLAETARQRTLSPLACDAVRAITWRHGALPVYESGAFTPVPCIHNQPKPVRLPRQAHRAPTQKLDRTCAAARAAEADEARAAVLVTTAATAAFLAHCIPCPASCRTLLTTAEAAVVHRSRLERFAAQQATLSSWHHCVTCAQ